MKTTAATQRLFDEIAAGFNQELYRVFHRRDKETDPVERKRLEKETAHFILPWLNQIQNAANALARFDHSLNFDRFYEACFMSERFRSNPELFQSKWRLDDHPDDHYQPPT